jgi:hypothetical protein
MLTGTIAVTAPGRVGGGPARADRRLSAAYRKIVVRRVDAGVTGHMKTS